MRRLVGLASAVLLATALAGAAIASGESSSGSTSAAGAEAGAVASAGAPGCVGRPNSPRERRDCRDLRLGRPGNPTRQRYDGRRIPTANSSRCDILDRAVCLQPWPNDYFTIADTSRDTGRRVNLNAASMPANVNSNHIDPTDYNRADGFSPGQLIVTHVPGLNNAQALAKTNPVGLTDLHAFTDANTPIVVINADTGERHPIFAELDTRATGNAVNVEIRPAVNFDEGGRYIVAMRNLKKANGKVIRASKVFRLYRDRLITGQRPIEKRRRKMESLFRTLRGAGIGRGNLFLAWDFTVASADSIAGRVLAMRNDAFADLGDTNLANNVVEGNAPNFAITSVVSAVDCVGSCDAPNEGQDALRIIDGTIEVPCYLSHPTDADECAPGSEFAFSGPDDLTPNRVGSATSDVPFRCLIPDSVDGGAVIDDAAPSLVGHGLLGNRGIINGTGLGANENNIFQCAMNWAGFSSEDVVTGIVPTLTNLSNFPKIGDHVQQAFVNVLYLGRAMIHPAGFVADEAFQIDPADPENLSPLAVDSDPVIDTDDLFYWGISHGGIMGGSLTALAPDHQRAVLNVPAMNHSTLLERSIHWDNYGAVLYSSYPNKLENPQTLSMIQMLWDRAEGNGFAQHMTTDPYANTPPHTVLMQASYGDHQVTNYAAEVMARTIGARIMTPALDAGLQWDSSPFMGIPAIASYPFTGSALVDWYGGPVGFMGLSGEGTAKPPLTNIPNRNAQGGGGDPHEYIIKDPEGRQQLSDFLQLGQLDDCGGDPPPCYSNGY
jgi:hypothetical protein